MMKSPGYRGGAVPEFVQYSTDKHKWTTISADNPEQTAICIYAAVIARRFCPCLAPDICQKLLTCFAA